MPGRQGPTFQKRQKEAKRLEKQRMKAEKRAARRAEKVQNAGRLTLGDQPEQIETALDQTDF